MPWPSWNGPYTSGAPSIDVDGPSGPTISGTSTVKCGASVVPDSAILSVSGYVIGPGGGSTPRNVIPISGVGPGGPGMAPMITR